MLISAPVWGFLPLRARRLETENVPNPVRAMRSFFFRGGVMLLVTELSAFSATALEHLQSLATDAINSAFVIFCSPPPLKDQHFLNQAESGFPVNAPR